MFRVLIVDDSHLLRNRVKEELLLAFPEISVIEAADGAACDRALDEHCVNLVIMDIRLKRENGLGFVPVILARCPGTTVVVHSMYDGEEYRQAAAGVGARYFLSKKKNTLQDMIAILERHAG